MVIAVNIFLIKKLLRKIVQYVNDLVNTFDINNNNSNAFNEFFAQLLKLFIEYFSY